MRQESSASTNSYLERRPERLVVEGYRRWMAGYETGSIEPWELAWSFYMTELGDADGRRAVSDLSGFVRALRGCAGCPLRMFPYGAKWLCREECLAVGLVAACQHNDVTLRGCCISGLGGCPRSNEITDAAGRYAATLMDLGQALLPIPAEMMKDIVGRPPVGQFH